MHNFSARKIQTPQYICLPQPVAKISYDVQGVLSPHCRYLEG